MEQPKPHPVFLPNILVFNHIIKLFGRCEFPNITKNEVAEMSVQIFSFALLACIVTAYGAKISGVHNTEIVQVEKEGRLLVVPTLEDVVYTGLKATWFLVSTAWSVVGYKLAAITLLANVAIWIAHNCLHAIIGAAVTLAFCKLSGKCTLDYGEYEPELVVAAKHLSDGTAKFSS